MKNLLNTALIALGGFAHAFALVLLAVATYYARKGVMTGSEAEFHLQLVVVAFTAIIAFSFMAYVKRHKPARVRVHA
jgi:hypothetical protein